MKRPSQPNRPRAVGPRLFSCFLVKKGTIPICAKHPVGHSGKWGQAPFSGGFTLVEMLVVVGIISILAGLTIPAVLIALRKGKETAVALEVHQLGMACQAYKEKFGEYPPDFAGLDNTNIDPDTGQTYQFGVRNQILRHLAKAFPRYRPGVSRGGTLFGWDGLRVDVLGNIPGIITYDSNFPLYEGWSVDINELSPASALAFFLGGKPEWLPNTGGTLTVGTETGGSFTVLNSQPIRGFRGYSANPLNPFDNSTSRIRPFYDFDINSVGWMTQPSLFGGTLSGFAYWPNVQRVVAKNIGPIVYFRAEGSNYTMNGATPDPDPTVLTGGSANVKNMASGVWPAIDTRLSNIPGMLNYQGANPTIYTWMNPKTFQIFASGLNLRFAAPNSESLGPVNYVAYPTGDNYGPETFDDITNFSNGTLESAIP